MKYIIFETPSLLEVPILFPDFIGHSDMASDLSNWKPVSAGFCKPGCVGKMDVWGRSTSLGLTSRETDDDLLDRAFDL